MTEVAVRGMKAGMKSVKELGYVQDGAPPGGFPAVRYARRLGSPGPTGVVVFGVGALISMYGFWRVGQANIKRNALKMEKMEAREALVALLQAEEDERFLRATKMARKAAEQKVG